MVKCASPSPRGSDVVLELVQRNAAREGPRHAFHEEVELYIRAAVE